MDYHVVSEVFKQFHDHLSYGLIAGVCATGVLVLLLKYWVEGPHYYGQESLEGKLVIVTGSNTGIGKETAREFVRRGARVIMACRNVAKGWDAANEISKDAKGQAIVYQLDLSSFKSIRKFVEEVLNSETTVDILVNNAGLVGFEKQTTEDGFDLTFQTNYLGPFLLTMLLLEKLKSCAPARIVNLASSLHKFGDIDWEDINMEKPGSYDGVKAYNQSKIAIILITKELSNKLKGTQVTTYAVNPGPVRTEIGRNQPLILAIIHFFTIRPFSKNAVQGAQPTIYCALAKHLANETGFYYSNSARRQPSKLARNPLAAKKLWDMTMKMTGLDVA